MPPQIWPGHRPCSVAPSAFSAILSHCLDVLHHQQSHSFSTTSRRDTRLRRNMFSWLNGPGAVFREPMPGTYNYLGGYTVQGKPIRPSRTPSSASSAAGEGGESQKEAGSSVSGEGEDEKVSLRPFPVNRHFISQPVLAESMREEIWRRVMQQGKTVKIVSAELGVEMSRIGAVVRLKEVEKRWEAEGKPLAKPYAKVVMDMLPKTYFDKDNPTTHESINDLPVHAATTQQIFHPTSESRVFTRQDAAKVFDPTLLPADQRIPHPELIEIERERQQGVPREERIARQRERSLKEAEDRAEAVRAKREREERLVTKVAPAEEGGKGGRWEWRFRNINVESVGRDGRAPTGVGWRYGVPHQDRKRGQVKIPTRVE